MRRSGLERKLVVGVLALFLIPTLAAGAILLLLYRRGTLHDPAALVLATAIGLALMMTYLGVIAHGLGKTMVRTLQEIQRGTELMATVNPDHRLEVRTGDEMEGVAREINRMADRVREARSGLEAEVARATRELAVERSKLSAVLADLDEGVVVATLEGRVTLANRKAQELLGASPGGVLGRSLADFVDPDAVAHHLRRLRAGEGGVRRFTLHPAGADVLQAAMTPFLDDGGGTTGFILALRDVSAPARHEEERQRLLGEALRGFRGPLASIRSLSESLLGDPALAGGGSGPLLGAIHAEAVRLSGLVAASGATALSGLARAPWHFEQIEAGELVGMVLGRLGHEPGAEDRVRVESLSPGVRLRAEAVALSAAATHLLRHLMSRRAPGTQVWLASTRRGRVVQMELGAETAASVEDLEPVLDARVAEGPVIRLSAREIIRRHAGETWAWTEGRRAGFRATLPVEDDAEVEPAPRAVVRFVGAGTRSGSAGAASLPPRPDLYDFSFFEEMQGHLSPADRERPLAALTLVVLDTETTGLRPEAGDRIISVAGVRVRAGTVKRSEVFDALVRPDRSIPSASARFHGITDEMVAQAPPIDVVLPAFLRFAQGAVLVGHEVWFDLQFLLRETRRLGLPPIAGSHPILDTRLLSQLIHPTAESHDLDAVARRLGVPIEGRHSALGDALATAVIVTRFMDLLRTRGLVTLGQVIAASSGAPRSREAGRTAGGSRA